MSMHVSSSIGLGSHSVVIITYDSEDGQLIEASGSTIENRTIQALSSSSDYVSGNRVMLVAALHCMQINNGLLCIVIEGSLG